MKATKQDDLHNSVLKYVREKIMDELAPRIKSEEYASNAFIKLHFADIEAMRSRIDNLEPEDYRRKARKDGKKVKELVKEIAQLREEMRVIKEDPMKLMRLSIDSFRLGEKNEQ